MIRRISPVTPYSKVRKEFHVYRSSTQAITTGTFTKVQLDTEVFDPDSLYDNASNYRYAPAAAGKYLIYGHVRMAGPDDGKRLIAALYKNGAEHIIFGAITAGATSAHSVGGAVVVEDDGNDYFELWVYHTHGSNLNVESGANKTYFGGFKLDT